jgi:Yip1 domain
MVDALITVLENPWISIWMSPRETIRKIVDRDPNRDVITLGALAGGLAMLNSALGASLGEAPVALPAWLVPYLPIWTFLSPFIGAAAGIAAIYASAFVFQWVGRALGGVASWREVCAASAWAEVPQICLAVVALGILLWTGAAQALLPSIPPADPDAAARATRHFTAGDGAAAIVSLWSVIIFIQNLAEVHRFSAWRALGALILVVLAFAALGLGIYAAMV